MDISDVSFSSLMLPGQMGGIIRTIGPLDVLDIMLVAIILYKMYEMLEDTRAITLMYENRLTLHLGTEDRLDDKLGTAVKTISAEADTSNNRTGAIDLTVIPYAFSRDTFADASVPETTDEATTESNNG